MKIFSIPTGDIGRSKYQQKEQDANNLSKLHCCLLMPAERGAEVSKP